MRHILYGPAMLLAVVAGCAEEPTQGPAGMSELSAPVVEARAAQAGAHSTHLSGANEVPANDSRGQGQATFRIAADGESLEFRLNVANIENVTQAHIHLGPADGTGPVVAWLYPSAPPSQLIPGRSQGVLGQGSITADDLVGPLAGMELSDLLEAIAAGNTYVNVHTSQIPPGEIRGQID